MTREKPPPKAVEKEKNVQRREKSPPRGTRNGRKRKECQSEEGRIRAMV